MILNCTNGRGSHPAPSSLLTTSQAAAYAGVHPNTLRTWADAGNIRTVRVADVGWRRYDANSIADYMGIEQEEKEQHGPQPCCYIRVSSETQDKQGNTKRQTVRMRGEVATREGIPANRVGVYSDIASSYGDRPSLNAMIEDVIAGKVSRIYVEYADRLSRTPSLTRLVESLCRNRGVEIVVINQEETEDIVQTAMMELVKFAQICGAKISGRRGAEAKRRELSPEILREAYLMKKEHGMSFRKIAREAEKRGWKDHKGRLLKGDAARNLITRRVTSQWSILEETYGKEVRQSTNSFDQFADMFITVTDHNGTRPTLMPRAKIVAAYSQWCEENNKLEVSPATLSKAATKRGWIRRMYEGKHVSYEGISLNLPRTKGSN